MLLIPCPYCGMRPQDEFHFRGDATVVRPGADASTDAAEEAFFRYVYLRDNPLGDSDEWWHHSAGCRQWIKVRRHTKTHAIVASCGATENLPQACS